MTAPDSGRSWDARPGAARAIRFVVLMGPISAGAAAAIAANHLIPTTSNALVAVCRSLLIVGLSTVAVWGVDRYARKLLPLAALMRLSLVFPDQAPSRFRAALRSGSSRRLERTLEETRRNGLASDPGDAARQVVQLIGAIGDHDRRTRGHSERVRLFADLIGEELKLSKEERQRLQWGALLHDLGKLMVPGEILNKAGKPDAEEWRILQGHPAAGMELIQPLREFLGEWADAIGGHHEKWDGSGYPGGLRGLEIPRAAAIVAVADSFEVMTAVRSYKKAMPLEEARAELTRCAGTHFSPEVVRAFLSISLGSLRVVSGPLAALAHLPFLGHLAQVPGAIATGAPILVSTASLPVAAMVTAASLTLAGPATAGAVEPAATGAQDTTVAAASSANGGAPSLDGSSDAGSSAALGEAAGAGTGEQPATGEDASGANAVTGAESNGASGASGAGASGVGGSGEAGPSTTVSVSGDAVAAPVATVTTTISPNGVTTTTSAPRSAPTTAAAPTTTAPATTAPPAPSTTVASSFNIMVSTNSVRLPLQNLNGSTFARGTALYICAPISTREVRYAYPGGERTATSFPFDMIGSSGLTALSFTAPSNPGTYTVTAVAKDSGSGSGERPAVVARFTVT